MGTGRWWESPWKSYGIYCSWKFWMTGTATISKIIGEPGQKSARCSDPLNPTKFGLLKTRIWGYKHQMYQVLCLVDWSKSLQAKNSWFFYLSRFEEDKSSPFFIQLCFPSKGRDSDTAQTPKSQSSSAFWELFLWGDLPAWSKTIPNIQVWPHRCHPPFLPFPAAWNPNYRSRMGFIGVFPQRAAWIWDFPYFLKGWAQHRNPGMVSVP